MNPEPYQSSGDRKSQASGLLCPLGPEFPDFVVVSTPVSQALAVPDGCVCRGNIGVIWDNIG